MLALSTAGRPADQLYTLVRRASRPDGSARLPPGVLRGTNSIRPLKMHICLTKLSGYVRDTAKVFYEKGMQSATDTETILGCSCRMEAVGKVSKCRADQLLILVAACQEAADEVNSVAPI